MPNWCENTLEVWGDEKELKEFVEKTIKENDMENGDNFHMGELLPIPKDKEDDWYNWNVTNYGTKWDDMSISYSVYGDSELKVDFMSAWAPPSEFIENIYKKFPNLHFKLRYDEPGMAFFGITTAGDGSYNDASSNY